MSQIKPTDNICYNCKYLSWMIGIGQGLRCGKQAEKGKMSPLVPSRFHTCEFFESKFTCKIDEQ